MRTKSTNFTFIWLCKNKPQKKQEKNFEQSFFVDLAKKQLTQAHTQTTHKYTKTPKIPFLHDFFFYENMQKHHTQHITSR